MVYFSALNGGGISVGVISNKRLKTEFLFLWMRMMLLMQLIFWNKEFEKRKQKGHVSNIYSVENLSVIGFVSDNYNKILSELREINLSFVAKSNCFCGKSEYCCNWESNRNHKNIIETEIYGKPKQFIWLWLVTEMLVELWLEQIWTQHDILNRKIGFENRCDCKFKKIAFNKSRFRKRLETENQIFKQNQA